MCNNPNLDLANLNAYIKFGETQFLLKVLSGNKILAKKGPQLWYNVKNNV